MPGEFILPEDFSPNPQIFLEEFREHMQKIKPVPVGQKYKKRAFVHKDLSTCTHVFLRVGVARKSLERPYSGPYKVINRTSDRVYEIDVNGTTRQVSVENIKPAYFLRDDLSYTRPTPNYSDTATNTGPFTSKTATDPVPSIKTYTKKKKVSFLT